MRWTPELAYAVGLIATDGSLSKDGRHINFTSKDLGLIRTFKRCLMLTNRIGTKSSGFAPERRYYNLQFGNVTLYSFLVDIGLTPAKSKTMGRIKVPGKYFSHFIRGLFDGDGSFYSYYDKRWPSSFMFYLIFGSASIAHIQWLREAIARRYGIIGHGAKRIYGRVYQLKYAKRGARKIIEVMYRDKNAPCLARKRKKIYNALAFDR